MSTNEKISSNYIFVTYTSNVHLMLKYHFHHNSI